MHLDPHVERLRHDLAVAAAAGGDDAVALAERLTAPLDAAARLVLLDVLSAAADEITRDLAPGSVDLRLRGRDPEFVVTPPPVDDPAETDAVTPADGAAVASSAASPPPWGTPGAAGASSTGEDGGTSRINLRLPDLLKQHVEEAAGRERLSVNAWLVRAAESALRHDDPRGPRSTTHRGAAPHGGGDRYSGWVR